MFLSFGTVILSLLMAATFARLQRIGLRRAALLGNLLHPLGAAVNNIFTSSQSFGSTDTRRRLVCQFNCCCIVQEAQLSPSDRAMRLVSSNLANYHATVQ